MNDRCSQVNPEDSRNRDTAAVASLTEAQPHFMNERAFQLLLRVQLAWAGASQRWSNHMWLNMPLQEARATAHMFHLGNSDWSILNKYREHHNYFFQAKEYMWHSAKVLKTAHQNMEESKTDTIIPIIKNTTERNEVHLNTKRYFYTIVSFTWAVS